MSGTRFKGNHNSPIIVFYDFENASTFEEVLLKALEREKELISQGFSQNDIEKIIFSNSSFKKSFINESDFTRLKSEFYAH